MSSLTIYQLPPGTNQHGAFATYTRLFAEKTQLKARLRDVENQLNSLEPLLLSYLAEIGFKSVTVEDHLIGNYLIGQRKDPWVKPAEGETNQTVCRVMRACNLGEYVYEQFHTRSFTNYVHDLEEEHRRITENPRASVREVLPEALLRVIRITPTIRISAKKL
jgi:hypothetical protein